MSRGPTASALPRAGAVCFRPVFAAAPRGEALIPVAMRPCCPSPWFRPARNVHVKFRLDGVGRPGPAQVFFQKLGRRTSRSRRPFLDAAERECKRRG